MPNSLADRLCLLRERSPYSQDDVARAIGSKQATLSSWERGQTEPGATHVAALARFYGVTTDYLCGLSDRPTPLTPKWDPAGSGPSTFAFTTDKRCVDYDIADGASSVIFHDDAGGSEDLARVVT